LALPDNSLLQKAGETGPKRSKNPRRKSRLKAREAQLPQAAGEKFL
jgi:hypothetical protein